MRLTKIVVIVGVVISGIAAANAADTPYTVSAIGRVRRKTDR